MVGLHLAYRCWCGGKSTSYLRFLRWCLIMTVMASTAFLGLVCLSAGLQAQDDYYLYTNLIKNGKGAYEDYVLAGERIRGSVAATLVSYDSVERLQEAIRLAESKAGESEDPASSSGKQLARLREALKALPTGPGRPTPLDFDRAIVRDFGPAWALVLRGNQKPRISPRSSVDATTLFPEFAQFRSLARAAMRKARVEFANGKATGALTTYRDSYRFIQRIGSEALIARLVTISCEAILFAEVERNLMLIPSAGLPEFIDDLRGGISGPPHLVECISVEQEFFRASVMEIANKLDSSDASAALPQDFDDVSPAAWLSFRAEIMGMSKQERRQFFKGVLQRHDSELLAFLDKLGEPENKWPLREPPARPMGNTSVFLNLHALDTTGIARIEAEARTRTRVAIITLLAREHAWQHGTYPAGLKDFLPGTASIDPLTNQPYKYTITNGAVVVKTAAHPFLGEISLRRPPQTDANSANGGRVILP